jgi:hypothetical protein
MTVGNISINGFTNTLTVNSSKYIAFASGTTTLFYQASAPTGWTKVTTHDNKALRVVSGTGGGSGGTGGNFTSVFANRSIPLPSHTHGGTTNSNSVDHTHSVSGNTGNNSADHTHGVSGNTGNNSADHSHNVSGGTGTQSANHTHTFSGTTGTDSPDHSHSETLRNVNNNGVTGGGNAIRAGAGTDAATTGGANARHSHGFSGTTSGVSNDHTHNLNLTTGGQSAAHNHSFSVTSATQSAAHNHSFTVTSGNQSTSHNHTFTTNTPTYGGTLGDTLDFSVQYIDVIIASLD